MSEKFAVVSYTNYGAPERCSIFNDPRKACAYLHWFWEDFLNDEIASGSHLIEDLCWHEDTSAAITWEDLSEMHIAVIPVENPFEEFNNVDWERYAP